MIYRAVFARFVLRLGVAAAVARLRGEERGLQDALRVRVQAVRGQKAAPSPTSHGLRMIIHLHVCLYVCMHVCMYVCGWVGCA